MKFQCAVCKSHKETADRRGNPRFVRAPKGKQICFDCDDRRVERDLARSGRATLGLANEGGKWFAVSASGVLKFPLIVGPKETIYHILKMARFEHKGHTYRGRLYQSGRVNFQRERKPQVKERATIAKRPTPPRAVSRTPPRRRPAAAAAATA
jgi:hypothetical protein